MPPLPEIRIRWYRPGDRDRVMQLAPRLTEGIAPWRNRADMLRSIEAAIRASIEAFRAPGRAVFVAVVTKQVVGLVTVSERIDFSGQREAYVGWLAVQAGMERRGIATKLMTAAENWAADRGMTSITLETGAANRPARSLYTTLGYEKEDIRFTKHSLARESR